MVAHVVMYKFDHNFEKMKNIAKARNMIEALPSKMEWINTLQVGVDFDRGRGAYDLCMYITFTTREKLLWFKSESAYLEVANFLKEVASESHFVDFVQEEDSCTIS